MKRILSFLLLAASIISCDRHSEYWTTISDVESYIEMRPDSALNVLQSINPDNLIGREEQAKHALLLSMAMDKNYIDTTDFSVLQPAIDFYGKKGTATDKLRTFYYQGRIYHNQNNEASAMTCYLTALDKGKESEDILTKARLLVAQGNIYDSLMKWEKLCEVNLKAADYFKQSNRINSLVNCLLKAAGGYIQKGESDKAGKYIQACVPYLNTVSVTLLGDYYSGYLTYLVSIDSIDFIQSAINNYLANIPGHSIDYISLANAYLQIGENEKALHAISKGKPGDNTNQKLTYYAVQTEIYKRLGMDRQALDCYEAFTALNDSVVLAVFEQDTQFIEEHYALELQTLKEHKSKNEIILWGILLILLLLAIVVYVRIQLKIKTLETERYKLLYQQIENEKDELKELLSDNTRLNETAKDVVAKRVELLNKFFTAHITNNIEIERKVDEELQGILDNKEEFMKSTKLAFTSSHPKFIQYLEDKGLTDREVQYCCLYALGLKGKEVGSYLKKRNHYNISIDVRKKLGLGEADTNLGIYIRKLLKTL